MTKVIRKEKMKTWVEALESGEYEQCQDKLSDGEGFCCLGVYAKINNIPFEVFEGDRLEDQANEMAYSKIEKHMSKKVNKSGLEMNDMGYSFKEIAQMIRKEYKL